jgi:hypothetical protein
VNYQASNKFSGLAVGTYSIYIKDGNGCTKNTSVTINDAPVLNLVSADKKAYGTSDVSCTGVADGEITVTANGGTGTITYSKDGGVNYQASNVFSGLGAATYSIYIKDGNGCTKNTSVTISNPPPVVIGLLTKKSYNGKDISCANAADGEVTVTAAGGTGGLMYAINDVGYQSSNVLTGLAAGTYNVWVKDANNCKTSQPLTISTTDKLIILEAEKLDYNGADLSCHNSSDGQITVSVTGGTGAKEYSKDAGANYQASNVFSGLGAGTYTIRVRDVNGCFADEVVTIVAPTQITASVTPSSSSSVWNGIPSIVAGASPVIKVRSGENVTLTSSASGGTGTLTHTWATTAATEPTDINGLSTVYAFNTAVAANSGTYTLTVTDLNSCTTSVAVTVVVYDNEVHVDATEGSDNNAGTQAAPFATIQKGIDATTSGDEINVAAGTYNESPTLIDARTITGAGSPTLGTNHYFIYDVSSVPADTITGFASATFNNVGAANAIAGGNTTAGIRKALNRVNAAGTVRIQAGTYSLSASLDVYSNVTLAGPVQSMDGTCALDPTASLEAASSGVKLVKFYGSGEKTVQDLVLKTADESTGRFIEIVSGSSGNVNTSRVVFKNSASAKLYGLQNDDRSAGTINDVAQLVNDSKDFGFGSGTVNYGHYAPLSLTNIVAGWKGEDGNTSTDGTRVGTLYGYAGGNLVNVQLLTRRPSFYKNEATVLNSRGHIRFDGVDEYLDANTTTTINGGDDKTVFVAFRTGAATTTDMVVYKHGDQTKGLSVVVDDQENIELNLYDGAATVTLSYAAAANTEYIAQIYFNGDSPAGNSTTNPRVGMAIDDAVQQRAEGKYDDGDFNVASLSTPAISTSSKISLGARVGSVYLDGATVIGTDRGNYFNGNIGEVIVLNTSDKTTRDAVYCYLRNKFFGSNLGVENTLERETDVIAGEPTTTEASLVTFPNPVDDEFQIEAIVPVAGQVRVTLLDAIGREVMSIFDGVVAQNASLPLSATVRDLPSGAYIVRMIDAAGTAVQTPIMVRH